MRLVVLPLILMLALAIFAGSGGNQSSSTLPNIKTTRGFLEMCAAVGKDASAASDLEKFETGYCLGWITGLEDGLLVAESAHGVDKKNAIFCLPVGNSYGQTLHVIEKFIADHPDKEHLSTDVIAVAALAIAFPCQASK